MNRKITVVSVCALLFFCLGAASASESMKVDLNKDGKPDVTYYYDEKYVTKAEADTNNDGKPDVIVYTQNGKFKSAEIDTNYDGKPDKVINDPIQFKKWVNENKPGFKDSLGWDDWSRTMLKVFEKPGANSY